MAGPGRGGLGRFIFALGVTVGAGRFFHVTSMIQFRPRLPPMTRNAALCFVLCGLAVVTASLKGARPVVVGLVLDVSLPGLSGLDLQKIVAAKRSDMPIIFITGYGDVPMTVHAMKTGAVEFLTSRSTTRCC